MSRIRRFAAPAILLAMLLLLAGKLLLTSVPTRGFEDGNEVWDRGVKTVVVPGPYLRLERGWPWAYGSGFISAPALPFSKPSIDSWPYFAADVAMLLTAIAAIMALAFWRRRRRTRWLQFSLRELMLLTALVGGFAGWWMFEKLQWQREQQSIAEMAPAEIEIITNYCGPDWPKRLWPIDRPTIFHRVVHVSATGGGPGWDKLPQQLLQPFHQLRQLEFMCYVWPHLTDFSGFPQLEELNIDQADDEMLESLPRLPKLRELHLNPSQVTDRGLRVIAQCRGLQVLDLGNNLHITAAGIAQLVALPQLLELNLSGAGPHQELPDSVVETLSKIPTLEKLYLACNGITDKGVKKLAAMPQLQTLVIPGEPQVSRETIDLLRQHIADVKEF